MSATWVDVNKSWGEFKYDRSEPHVGLVIEVRHLGTDSSPEYIDRYLVGDINELGGACDDCSVVKHADIVLRKRRVHTDDPLE